MVAGIERISQKGGNSDDGPEGWRQLRRQYIAMINTLVTIGGTFVFFYKAVEYSLPEPNIPAQVLVAILASLVVAVSELYFLLRSI
ncbi:uncharacterized protein LOC111242792 [Varroa destructor]|uniref:Uncharacterized protein n=1 Tax=Varroa destructor TaxID=109461 RepID=A0A7M7J354_VARDE|nr:uncharacterized protein LOC111242792 [Varroa destructor]